MSGISVRHMVEPRIQNKYLKIGAAKFFDVGEYVVDKSVEFVNKARTGTHLEKEDPNKKDAKLKPPQPPKRRNRYVDKDSK